MARPLRLLGTLLAALAAAPTPALVAAVPPVVTVAPGREPGVVITWTFEREPFTRLESAHGAFIGPFALAPLASVRASLVVTLTRGAGTVTEKLAIPPMLLEAMRARGLTQVAYVRLFGESEGTVTLRLGGGAGKVSVEQVELGFPGGAAEVAVARRGTVPPAVATVHYQGAGPLEADWEVDGKVHARVSRAVDVLGLARFEVPELPPLPTETPGAHRLRFVPVRTARGTALPVITYRVGEDAPEAAPAPVTLTAPAPEAALPFEEIRLAWARGRGAVYLVDLRDCDSGAALFSAYTRETSFRLPAFGVSPHLVPGRVICWRVLGFGDDGQAIEASEVRRLRVTPPRGAP